MKFYISIHLIILFGTCNYLIAQHFEENIGLNQRNVRYAIFDAEVEGNDGNVTHINIFRFDGNPGHHAITHIFSRVRKGEAIIDIPFWLVREIKFTEELSPTIEGRHHYRRFAVEITLTNGDVSNFILHSWSGGPRGPSRGYFKGVSEKGDVSVRYEEIKRITLLHDSYSFFCPTSGVIIFSNNEYSPFTGEKMSQIRPDITIQLKPYRQIPEGLYQ